MRSEGDRVDAGFGCLVGRSAAMHRAIARARRVARHAGTTVTIRGESGTGKEVLARAIHAESSAAGRFVAVNCAGIPSGLLESELFGHIRGAFTGADCDRVGKLELAQDGTLLLDEIGDMPKDMQAKLLRVLQERSYERVGCNTPRPVRARIICTTNCDLDAAQRTQRFRSDLFHRINVVTVHLPPLRDRREDIPALAEHFMRQLGGLHGILPPRLTPAATHCLTMGEWPGNVRQLRNCIERSLVLNGTNNVIDTAELELCATDEPARSDSDVDDGKIRLAVDLPRADFSLDAVIASVLEQVLARCDGNKSRAAELLKVDRKRFYRLSVG